MSWLFYEYFPWLYNRPMTDAFQKQLGKEMEAENQLPNKRANWRSKLTLKKKPIIIPDSPEIPMTPPNSPSKACDPINHSVVYETPPSLVTDTTITPKKDSRMPLPQARRSRSKSPDAGDKKEKKSKSRSRSRSRSKSPKVRILDSVKSGEEMEVYSSSNPYVPKKPEVFDLEFEQVKEGERKQAADEGDDDLFEGFGPRQNNKTSKEVDVDADPEYDDSDAEYEDWTTDAFRDTVKEQKKTIQHLSKSISTLIKQLQEKEDILEKQENKMKEKNGEIAGLLIMHAAMKKALESLAKEHELLITRFKVKCTDANKSKLERDAQFHRVNEQLDKAEATIEEMKKQQEERMTDANREHDLIQNNIYLENELYDLRQGFIHNLKDYEKNKNEQLNKNLARLQKKLAFNVQMK